MRVVVVETGHANMTSVCRALEVAAPRSDVTIVRGSTPEDVRSADKLVVPGQGGFAHCLAGIRSGVGDSLVEAMRKGTPYLGICLGLQALFASSEEAPGVEGLGWFSGSCQKLREEPGIKIPHMGWNRIEIESSAHPIFRELGPDDRWFYFVHSYHAVPADPGIIAATATHGATRVTAAVARDNVIATQFHPEKSQAAGQKLLGRFLAL